MKYKIHPRYKDFPCVYEKKIFKQSLGLVKTKVIGISKQLPKKCSGGTQPDYEYDIRVKDNSNYFTNEILVHNTNVSIIIQEGTVMAIFNRTERIPFINKGKRWIVEAILEAKERGYIDKLGDGQWWGEVIGPRVNGNPYKLDTHIWIPFATYAQDHLLYKSWGKYPKDFKTISTWFKDDLLPLFMLKRGFKKDDKEAFVEGVVFTHPTGKMAKLRRDMFDWYSGERHRGKPQNEN